jgi:asparagine synthase (glutamine-hydrolysing)
MTAIIDIAKQNQWLEFELPQLRGKLYFKGYLHAKTVSQLALEIPELPESRIASYVCALDGHFALVLQTAEWSLAVVDKIASIPLFYVLDGDCWRISCQASRLVTKAGLGLRDVDNDAVLALAMSGYTVGNATLYRSLQALTAGEAVYFEAYREPRRCRYYRYTPWQEPAAGDYRDYLAALSGATLKSLQKMLAGVGNRQIVIPLSAGSDSRLIASGLKRLGAVNVKCFTYGIPGNFEAQISRQVAEKLGYEWRFVPLSHRLERAFYRSEEFKRYWREVDTCMAVPYIQGLSATKYLKESGWIDADAVFVNGNTGDFISGGHIPQALCDAPDAMTKEEALARLQDEFLKKHFSLWENLKTRNNMQNIAQQLRTAIMHCAEDAIPACAPHGIYEYLELLHRQSKYILANQRIYEFYGYEWRLPLWDDAYLSFWAKVPTAMKARQNLYKNMLKQQNWGGVWDNGIPVNRRTIRPKWLIPLRFLAKCWFAPWGRKGRKAWKRFELNVFYYWRDVALIAALFPYRKLLFDRRGARHIVAFLAEYYLAEKGVKESGGYLNTHE